MPTPYLKNKGPLLVDKVRGYFDRLPPWLRDVVTIRVEKQKVDAKITDLDATALESELKQEVTDEKLKTNRFLGNGEPGSGNDMSGLPASHPSEVVITQTGQVANVTESVSATETHLVEGPPLQDGTSEKVGDVWVTKKVEAPTFDRKVFQKTVDDLLPAEFRASIPQVLTQNTVNGVAATPTLGVNDQVKKEEQVKVGVKEVTVQSRDLSGTKPTLIGQKVDRDFNGATVYLDKDIVPDATAINQVFGVTDTAVLPYDDKNAVRETWQAKSGFPRISLVTYDNELNHPVITSLDLVPQGSSFTATSDMLDYEERKIDAKHTLRVTNYLSFMPPMQTTYSTQMITFPAILSYISFQLVPLAAPATSGLQYTAGVRAAFTTPTVIKTETTFSVTEPVALPVFIWKPTDVTYKGLSYSVNLNNVLTDAWSNIGVTYAADATYGNAVDRFSIAATLPSASAYTASIGTQQRVGCTVERYKRLWVLKSISMVIA